MPLNPDAVGYVSEPSVVSWTSKDALLYAVSLGAGRQELQYTTENSQDVTHQLLPTFPVVIPGATADAFAQIGPFDWAGLVHGSQAVTLHRPVPVEGTATVVAQITAMYDKGNAAVVLIDTVATSEGGQPLFTTGGSFFIRGAGGWGGDRGPKAPVDGPPEREPDHVVVYETSPDQALLYRLNGDRNPLHSDPSFARRAGFDRPILHGLCTYGFTGRALLWAWCEGESSRFKHITGRFSSPVMPGDELTIRTWELGAGEAAFTTSVGDRVVIDQGVLHFTPSA
jgi:acyl dehydratase